MAKQNKTNGKMVVRRAFTYNGRQYEQGDTIELIGAPNDAKLIEHRLVIPAPSGEPFQAWPARDELPSDAAAEVEALEQRKAAAVEQRDKWASLLEERQGQLEQARADGRVHAEAEPAAVAEARALESALADIVGHVASEVQQCESAIRAIDNEINQVYHQVAQRRRRLHELEQQAAVAEATRKAAAAALR